MTKPIHWPDNVPRNAVAERMIAAICAGNPPSEQSFTALGDDEWEALDATAVRTRTFGLLHRHIIEHSLTRLDHDKHRITELYRTQSLYALGQRIVLGQVVGLLEAAGIEHVALKGSALAFSSYPQPAMRPLRDIDVLVPLRHAQDAHDLLLRHGFTAAEWAGDYGTELLHQMPELVSPEHEVTVEIHHRLFPRKWDGDAALSALLLQSAQAVSIGSSTARLAAPLANALHLTLHATLHNCFENGPLTISDFRFLWANPALDKQVLFEEAERLGLIRPLALLLAIMRSLSDISIPSELSGQVDAAERFVPHAFDAMFRTPAEAQARGMARRMEINGLSSSSPMAAFGRMIAPTSQQLADIAGTRASNPARWLAYPAWAWNRGRRWIGNLADPSLRADAQTDARMLSWLQDGDPAG